MNCSDNDNNQSEALFLYLYREGSEIQFLKEMKW